MTLVIDSSVAVKLVAPEDGQDEAYEMLRATTERIAPTHMIAEAANPFWTKVERDELTQAQAHAGMGVLEDAITRFADEKSLMADALQMALDVSHPLYDCIYLALAERENRTLVTADPRLIRKMRSTSYSHLVHPLVAVS